MDPSRSESFSSDARKFLDDCGVIETHADQHYLLPSSRHSLTYLNLERLLTDRDYLREGNHYARLLAHCCRDIACDVIVGAEPDAKVLAQLLETELSRKRKVGSRHVTRDAHGFHAPNSLFSDVAGKRVLVVQNVLSEGRALAQVINLVLVNAGEVVAVAVGWNRGGRMAKDLGVTTLVALVSEPIQDFAPGLECPACRKGVPLASRLKDLD